MFPIFSDIVWCQYHKPISFDTSVPPMYMVCPLGPTHHKRFLFKQRINKVLDCQIHQNTCRAGSELTFGLLMPECHYLIHFFQINTDYSNSCVRILTRIRHGGRRKLQRSRTGMWSVHRLVHYGISIVG